MRRVYRAAAILLCVPVVGCESEPSDRYPEQPPVLANRADSRIISSADAHLRWWSQFEDPMLDRLMTQALARNFDLATAVARVGQARALFSETRLDLLPHVSSDASYTRGKEQIPGITQDRVDLKYADVGLDAAWEIDLFGRVRHQVQAARAEVEASEEDLAAARVSVAAELARNYFVLRGSQQQQVIVSENVVTARETLRLTTARFDTGGASSIDTEGAKVQLNSELARLPDLANQEAQASARIAVLCGRRPGELDAELAAPSKALPAGETPLAVGDLSELLKRRPDVRAAQRRLAAEAEHEGAARADLFPRLELTGFVGFLSGDVTRLFASNGRAWSVTPTVTWPAFDIGSAAARLRAQKAARNGALAEYQQVSLLAIEELQNALSGYRNHREQLGVEAARMAAATRQFDLAQILYREGSIDYLRLLSAQRDKLAAQEELVVTQTATNADAVAIYKALGGVARDAPGTGGRLESTATEGRQ
jgi:outer membrane protein, multidrug efflux system